MSSRDLYEALALERDRDPTDAEILAGEQKLVDYVRNRVLFTGDDRPCEMVSRGVRIIDQTDRFVEIRYGVHCQPGSKVVSIHYNLFFELDARHVSQLTLTRGERTITQQELTRPTQQDPRANIHDWDLGPAFRDRGTGAVDRIALGLSQLYAAYASLAFLIGLLLVAPLRRAPGGAGDAAWAARESREGGAHLGRILGGLITAQTVASVAGALGWITLPAGFIHAAVAASVVYIAVENIWIGDPRHRWHLAVVFGLLHGLAFATALRPYLPPANPLAALLAANLGILLGQLGIAIVLYPLLQMIARGNAATYRRTVVLCGSLAAGALGALWLIERILSTPLLGRYLG